MRQISLALTLTNPHCEQRNRCRLTATIGGQPYGVTPVPAEASEVIKAWKLRKRDGTEYVVADTIDGATCECADQTFRHDGRDQTGCKHIRALRELGLIDTEGDDAHGWPAWTDTHAYRSR